MAHARDATYRDEDAKLFTIEEHGPELRGLLTKLKKERDEYLHSEANRLFFINETNLLGMVPDTHKRPLYGHPQDVMLGLYTKQPKFIARFGLKYHDLDIIAKDWGFAFDVRTDTPTRAHIYCPEMFTSDFSLGNANEALPSVNNVVQMVEAYKELVRTQRFEKERGK